MAKELHFTRAAELCNLSQPAFSRKIQRLEEQLGVLLFERDKQSVELTKAGKMFFEKLEPALHYIEQALHMTRTIHGATPKAQLYLSHNLETRE